KPAPRMTKARSRGPSITFCCSGVRLGQDPPRCINQRQVPGMNLVGEPVQIHVPIVFAPPVVGVSVKVPLVAPASLVSFDNVTVMIPEALTLVEATNCVAAVVPEQPAWAVVDGRLAFDA